MFLRVPHEAWADIRTDIAAAAEGVQLAARLVDTPPNFLHTSAFVEEAMAVARGIGGGVTLKVVRGDDLATRGFGGLYGVGKAAVEPPALVVLSHVVDAQGEGSPAAVGAFGGGSGASAMPTGRDAGGGSLCFVGKGIVYDTGGLSIKTKTGMVGLRRLIFGSSKSTEIIGFLWLSHVFSGLTPAAPGCIAFSVFFKCF